MVAQEIIDVLIVVDAASIAEQFPPGTVDSPTSVSAELIMLVVRQSNAIFGQGSKELSLKAQTLDTIRWRATSLTLDAAYDAMLYAFFALKGSDLISAPTPLLADVDSPLPNPDDPIGPGQQTIKDYFWSTVVERAGEATYAFHFMIAGRDGVPQGYYSWDPFVRISD